MKLIVFTLLIFYLFIPILTIKAPIPSWLTNTEIKQIMNCFGDWNMDEGCVICRYVTQKINKVLDLSTMCPDVTTTQFIKQRSRTWTPNNNVINKWITLYNQQKAMYNKKIGPGNIILNKPNLDNMAILQRKFGEIQPLKSIGQESFLNNKDYNNEIINYENIEKEIPKTPIEDINQPKQENKPFESIDVYYPQSNSNWDDIYSNKDILSAKADSFFNDASGDTILPIQITKDVRNNNNVGASDQIPTVLPNNGGVNFVPNGKTFLQIPQFASSFIEEDAKTDAKTSVSYYKQQLNYKARSRFPDMQWNCAKEQWTKWTKYICSEEVSATYQKYCKPIFEQINLMVESFLYNDNNIEICQNLHMCPIAL